MSAYCGYSGREPALREQVVVVRFKQYRGEIEALPFRARTAMPKQRAVGPIGSTSHRLRDRVINQRRKRRGNEPRGNQLLHGTITVSPGFNAMFCSTCFCFITSL